MKKITKDEFNKASLSLGPKGRIKTELTMAIIALKVNEGLSIEKSEYDRKTPFHCYINIIGKNQRMRLRSLSLADGSRWYVLRIK